MEDLYRWFVEPNMEYLWIFQTMHMNCKWDSNIIVGRICDAGTFFLYQFYRQDQAGTSWLHTHALQPASNAGLTCLFLLLTLFAGAPFLMVVALYITDKNIYTHICSHIWLGKYKLEHWIFYFAKYGYGYNITGIIFHTYLFVFSPIYIYIYTYMITCMSDIHIYIYIYISICT